MGRARQAGKQASLVTGLAGQAGQPLGGEDWEKEVGGME